MQKNMPEKKFSTGAVSATIWRNTTKDKTGKDIEYRTISVQRTYKDNDDQWQTTSTLRVHDLPKALLVLNKAYEYIVLKDMVSKAHEEELVL
jgi:hypothetical protein